MNLAMSVVIDTALLALLRVKIIQSHRNHGGLFFLHIEELN